ncbi:MAG TPA: hypothetical protein VFM18_16040 [Methanosarcina sp.]|nr:hypothetical protein [Methanosarcina sp.]
MARPSALSPKKWEELIKRVPPLGTESIRSVAKEYGISEGAIRKRVNTHEKPILNLANQIAATETEFEKLPFSTQVKVRNLADEIKGMQFDLASAGKLNAQTAKMFSQAAHDATSRIMFKAMSDDGETISPERLAECGEELLPVMKSLQIANEAGKIPLKIAEISSKQKEEDKPKDLDDAPVKFYIPSNGRN